VEEFGAPGENLSQVIFKFIVVSLQTLSHSVVHHQLPAFVVLGTDYIGRCKSNYHTTPTIQKQKAEFSNINQRKSQEYNYYIKP